MLDFYVYIGYYKWAVASERLIHKRNAEVAELADAQASGACV